MKIKFFIAGILAVISCCLTYFEYLPFYFSIVISVCSFIMAMTSSVISAIQGVQHANKENQEKALSKIGLLSSALSENLTQLSSEISRYASDNNSSQKEIQDLIRENNSAIDRVSNEFSRKIVEKIELLCNALGDNSSDVSSLTSTLDTISSKLSSDTEQIKDTLSKAISTMSDTVQESSDALTQKVADITEKLSQLKTNIEAYNISALGIKDSNTHLANRITDTISALDRICSNITLQNKRLLDELNDSFRSNIDDLLKGVKDAADTQAESFSNTENSLKKSVDSLCSGLSTNIKKLGIDIEDICNSISDMKQMSDFVEQSDKDLLAKISKICK